MIDAVFLMLKQAGFEIRDYKKHKNNIKDLEKGIIAPELDSCVTALEVLNGLFDRYESEIKKMYSHQTRELIRRAREAEWLIEEGDSPEEAFDRNMGNIFLDQFVVDQGIKEIPLSKSAAEQLALKQKKSEERVRLAKQGQEMLEKETMDDYCKRRMEEMKIVKYSSNYDVIWALLQMLYVLQQREAELLDAIKQLTRENTKMGERIAKLTEDFQFMVSTMKEGASRDGIAIRTMVEETKHAREVAVKFDERSMMNRLFDMADRLTGLLGEA